MSNPRIDILVDYTLIDTIDADLTKVGTINGKQERKGFDFVHSDFSFSMRNGQAIYDLLKAGTDVEIVVQDDAQRWFRGYLDAESAEPGDVTGEYTFMAVSSGKKKWDALKDIRYKGSGFIGAYYHNDVGGWVMYDNLRLEVQMVMLESDFTGNNPLLTWDDSDAEHDYSAYDFMVDCAYRKNAYLWVDADNTLRMKDRTESGAITEINSDLLFDWNRRLQSRDYEKVVYSTVVSYTNAELEDLIARIHKAQIEFDLSKVDELLQELAKKINQRDGRWVIVVESLDSEQVYDALPDAFDYRGALDIRTPKWARGKSDAVTNTIFPMLSIGQVKTDPVRRRVSIRRGDWDSLLRPKEILEIGLRGLTKYDPYTRVRIYDKTGKIIEQTYDIVKKTTTLTLELE